ncbi:MAG TPA: hypothetical protein VMB34_00785 [Acetobacteraceae bacterium]|nr:hypothetical protein [Acetobacteraceae bacterium]
MKKLLVAASMAAGLAVGAVPAFAQPSTTAAPRVSNSGNGAAASSVQAQNFPRTQPQAGYYAAPPSQPGWQPPVNQWGEPNG